MFASRLFSLPDAFHSVTEGMSATGPQLLVATLIAFVPQSDRGGLAAAVSGATQHMLVRRLPGAHRDGHARAAGYRDGSPRRDRVLLRMPVSTSNTARRAGQPVASTSDEGREQAAG